jgi:hypothetical protein
MRTENERLRALAPISDDEVAALALDGERELARAIAERPRRRPFALLRGGHGERGRPPLAALVASVALVALAGVGLAVGISGSGGSTPAGGPAGAVDPTATGAVEAGEPLPERVTTTPPATTLPAATVPDEAVELTERGPGAQPPRYLLPVDWHVTRVDEQDRDGEMTFERDGSTLDLHWRTGSFHEWLEDRSHDAERLADVEVDGGRAAVFASGRGFFTGLWQAGDFTFEFRVGVTAPSPPETQSGTSPPELNPSATLTADQFAGLLRSLRTTTLRDWLAAVPEQVVRLDERPHEVDAMLADVPLPPGFDTADLKRGELVKDRYQLGATVISAVSCEWIDRWAAARRAGDRAGVALASGAMARVADSAILREMADQGGYTSVLKDFAAATARPDGRTFGGKGAVADEAAKEGLSCSMR